MKLVWHLVKNDFRRMWVPLAMWALVLAIKNEVGVLLTASTGLDPLRFEALGYWALAFTGFGMLVNFILVATLVQEDALVGSRMFWMTRPISGGRLLAAKAISAVLMFGVLPLAISLRWWLASGYDVNEISRAAVATLDGQIVVVVPALILAALTGNMNRFLGWSLGAVLVSAVVAWRPVTLDPSYLRVPETMGIITTKIWLMSLIWVVAAGLVVVQQFRHRRTGRALAVVAIAVGSMVVVKQAWSWDWSGKPPKLEASSPLGQAVNFKVERARMVVSRDGSGSVALDYGIEGLEEKMMVVRARADHFWKFPDGKEVIARSNFRNGAWAGRAEWQALGLASAQDTSLRNYRSSGPPGFEENTLRLVSWMRASNLGSLRSTTGSYRADLEVELLRPANWIELPLRDGEEKQRGSLGVHVGAVERRGGEVKVSLTESRPMLETYGNTTLSLTSLSVWSRGEDSIALGYALVNRVRGEAIKLWPRAAKANVGVQQLRHLTFTVTRPEEELGAWLEGATLVVIYYQSLGLFSSEAAAASLTVNEEEAL